MNDLIDQGSWYLQRIAELNPEQFSIAMDKDNPGYYRIASGEFAYLAPTLDLEALMRAYNCLSSHKIAKEIVCYEKNLVDKT